MTMTIHVVAVVGFGLGLVLSAQHKSDLERPLRLITPLLFRVMSP